VLFILTVLLYRDKPPTPPSASKETGQKQGFISSIKGLFSNKDMILLALVLG